MGMASTSLFSLNDDTIIQRNGKMNAKPRTQITT